MIVRTWVCPTSHADVDAAAAHILRTGVSECGTLEGYPGSQPLRYDEDSVARRIVLRMYWDSLEAIERFAGRDLTRAVLYPDDDRYGIQADDAVTHGQVIYCDPQSTGAVDVRAE